MPDRFRKKPVVIEAMPFRRENAEEVASWCGGQVVHDVKPSDHDDVATWVRIPTLEGVMTAQLGDWVIKGVQGEFYPVKNDIFEATYERVTE